MTERYQYESVHELKEIIQSVFIILTNEQLLKVKGLLSQASLDIITEGSDSFLARDLITTTSFDLDIYQVIHSMAQELVLNHQQLDAIETFIALSEFAIAVEKRNASASKSPSPSETQMAENLNARFREKPFRQTKFSWRYKYFLDQVPPYLTQDRFQEFVNEKIEEILDKNPSEDLSPHEKAMGIEILEVKHPQRGSTSKGTSAPLSTKKRIIL